MHELWKTSLNVGQHEVIVITHRAVRMNLHAESSRRVGETELEDLVGRSIWAEQ